MAGRVWGQWRRMTTAAQACEADLARPYSEVPGPRALPLLGNTWRLLPYIGKYHKSSQRVGPIKFEVIRMCLSLMSKILESTLNFKT